MPAENKSEKPTPRRRQKAREQGQVARSRELGSLIGTLLALLPLSWQAHAVPGYWRTVLRIVLDRGSSGELLMGSPLLMFAGGAAILAALPVMSLAWAACLVSTLAQGGVVVAPSALAPKASRLSPASKMRQLFSVQSMFGMLKSLVPAVFITYFVLAILSRDWPVIRQGQNAGLGAFSTFLFSRLFGALLEMQFRARSLGGAGLLPRTAEA